MKLSQYLVCQMYINFVEDDKFKQEAIKPFIKYMMNHKFDLAHYHLDNETAMASYLEESLAVLHKEKLHRSFSKENSVKETDFLQDALSSMPDYHKVLDNIDFDKLLQGKDELKDSLSKKAGKALKKIKGHVPLKNPDDWRASQEELHQKVLNNSQKSNDDSRKAKDNPSKLTDTFNWLKK